MESNLGEQIEEIEALISIYGNKWHTEQESDCYSIEIIENIKLFIKLNESYPSKLPPKFELLAPYLNNQKKQEISKSFEKIYQESCGGPILFQWIEKLREIVYCNENSDFGKIKLQENEKKVDKPEFPLNVTHGSIIQDRKSVFQGHCCLVNSMKEVESFMDYLMENKKISQATHKISAYRITLSNKTILQDCNDDGESHAGGRLLHLLQILNLKNVVIVVSRWYGGIHLGPDRFKHINNAARDALMQGKFLKM